MINTPAAELSDFCTIVQGGRHKLSGNDFIEDGFPAYGAGGLNGYLPSFEFDRPAVILSSIGARCGKCFIVEGRWSSLANTQVILPDEKRADARFLWFQLNNEKRWHRSGSAQPFIKPSDVKSQRVFLPSLQEQRRIAAILGQADALRSKRRAAVRKAHQLAQAAFMAAFGDPADNPMGWPVEQMSALVRAGDSINYGVIQPGEHCDDGIHLVRVGDLMNGRIQHRSLKRISKKIESGYQRSRLKGDEILVSCVGSIGQVALATPAEKDFNIARAVARIRVSNRVSRVFIAEYLNTPHVQRYFTSELRTVSQPTLNIKQIGETPVFVPPIADQDRFCAQIAGLSRVREKLDASEMALEGLFASLQHRAFRGEL